MAIQCLVPEESNQSPNQMLMFIYLVKIEGVHSCMACVIGKTNYVSINRERLSVTNLSSEKITLPTVLCDLVAVRYKPRL